MQFDRVRKTAAFEQACKAGIVSKRVPFGIDGQEHEMHIVRVVAAVEPFQGNVVLSKSGVHYGHRIRRNIPFVGDR